MTPVTWFSFDGGVKSWSCCFCVFRTYDLLRCFNNDFELPVWQMSGIVGQNQDGTSKIAEFCRCFSCPLQGEHVSGSMFARGCSWHLVVEDEFSFRDGT